MVIIMLPLNCLLEIILASHDGLSLPVPIQFPCRSNELLLHLRPLYYFKPDLPTVQSRVFGHHRPFVATERFYQWVLPGVLLSPKLA